VPSSFTPLNRFEEQNPGENLNTWGSKLNADTIALIDFAISGRTALTPSGPITLTTANGAADQGRSAILDLTSGTGGTITIPALSHVYQVHNNCSGNAVFTTGSGISATVEPGSLATVICDGTNCYRFADAADIAVALAAAEAYTDAAAFSSASGNLPGQGGNAGKFLVTNGTSPSWLAITSLNVTTALGFTPQVALGFTPLNPANNLSDVGNVGTARTNLGVSQTGMDPAYNLKTNNLSDVASVATARTNLGVTATGADAAYAKVANNLSDLANAATARTNLGIVVPTYAQFRNAQTNGSGSGETLTSATWKQRVLNTTVANTISGASLGSNQITLPAGTYYFSASVPSLNTSTIAETISSRLRNITDGSTISVSQAILTQISASTSAGTVNTMAGVFVLAASKVIEIDTYMNTSGGTASGGSAVSGGESEIYTDITFMKIA
jgi:hypothetical protein